MYLFHLEDSFTPDSPVPVTVSSDELWFKAFKHIKGDKSTFISWSKNLQVALAKYYHAPLAGEPASLYITDSVYLWNHERHEKDVIYLDIGKFNSYGAAKGFFSSKGITEEFPSAYSPIEDEEVLTNTLKLLGLRRYRFGYEVFFLIMIAILFKDKDVSKVLNAAEDVISTRLAAHDQDLVKLNMTRVTVNDWAVAYKLVSIFRETDAHLYTLAELKRMPIHSETLPMGKYRIEILDKLISDVEYQICRAQARTFI